MPYLPRAIEPTLRRVDVKLAATLWPDMARGIERYREIAGSGVLPGCVVTTGREVVPVTRSVTSFPFSALAWG